MNPKTFTSASTVIEPMSNAAYFAAVVLYGTVEQAEVALPLYEAEIRKVEASK